MRRRKKLHYQRFQVGILMLLLEIDEALIYLLENAFRSLGERLSAYPEKLSILASRNRRTAPAGAEFFPSPALVERRRAMPSLAVGIGILFAPLVLFAMVLSNPDVFSPFLVSGVLLFCIVLLFGLTLLIYRRIRLNDGAMALMGISMVLSFSLVLPAAVQGVTSAYQATALVYGVCLAFFVLGGSALYVTSAAVFRPRWHEIGA